MVKSHKEYAQEVDFFFFRKLKISNMNEASGTGAEVKQKDTTVVVVRDDMKPDNVESLY